MAWWLYVGKVTTPISGGITAVVDEKGEKPKVVQRNPSGPAVLTPRLRFEASFSASLAHLVRRKMVVPLKPHMLPKEEKPVKEEAPKAPPPPPKKEAPAPAEVPKSEETTKKSSDSEEHVVASGASEPGEEEKQKAQQEKQQEKGGKKGSKKRRG